MSDKLLLRSTRDDMDRKSVEEEREFEEFMEKRNTLNNTGIFYYDESKIPEGMIYEWKRVSYVGKEDTEYQLHLARIDGGGWKPVPSERHPEQRIPTDQPIIRGGQMLMETKKKFVDYMRAKAVEENSMALANNRKQVEVSGTPEMPRVVQRYSTVRS